MCVCVCVGVWVCVCVVVSCVKVYSILSARLLMVKTEFTLAARTLTPAQQNNNKTSCGKTPPLQSDTHQVRSGNNRQVAASAKAPPNGSSLAHKRLALD